SRISLQCRTNSSPRPRAPMSTNEERLHLRHEPATKFRHCHDNQPLDEALLNSVPKLVGEVYEAAPPRERSRLLEHLMRPLGVLSLAVVANGAFSKLRFFGGGPDPRVP